MATVAQDQARVARFRPQFVSAIRAFVESRRATETAVSRPKNDALAALAAWLETVDAPEFWALNHRGATPQRRGAYLFAALRCPWALAQVDAGLLDNATRQEWASLAQSVNYELSE